MIKTDNVNSNYLKWEEPIPIIISCTPSFPIEIFPNWISNYVEGISQELNTQDDLVANTVFPALSTCLDDKFIFFQELMNWRLGLNIFILIAADPGSKKDAVANRVFKVINEIQNQKLETLKETEPEMKSRLDLLKKKYEKLLEKSDGKTEPELKDLMKQINNLENALNIPRWRSHLFFSDGATCSVIESQ